MIKVIPAPYGVQRRMNPDDDRIEQLTEWMKYDNIDNPINFCMLVIMKVLMQEDQVLKVYFMTKIGQR